MVQSDALSRRPDLCPDEDNNNEDIVMLPDSMFLNLIDTALQDKIANANDLDQQAIDALNSLLNDTLTAPSPLKNDLQNWSFTEENGHRFLFYKNETYVPRNIELRREILQNFHDGEAEGGEAESGADSEARTMANAMMILSKSTNEHCMVRSHDESRGMAGYSRRSRREPDTPCAPLQTWRRPRRP